jgi:branched-chain amino acid transport system permease protein
MNFGLAVVFVTMCYALAGLAAGWFRNRLGLLSVAHGAVIGSGAYAFAFASRSGIAGYFSLLAALLVGAIVGWGFAVVSERVIGDEFALASFCLQIVWLSLIRNLTSITGGPLGIGGIRSVSVSGLANEPLSHCLLVTCFGCIVVVARLRIARSPFVAAAAFVRRSRELAVTLGIPSFWIRSQVGLAYGAVLGAVGGLLASFVTYVGPDDFTTSASVSVLAIAFIMKNENLRSAVLGSAVIVGAPQLLRLVGVSAGRVGFGELFLSGVVVMGSQMGQRKSDVRP